MNKSDFRTFAHLCATGGKLPIMAITERAAIVLQEIDAALALADKATPGPWEYDERPGQQTVMALDGKATVALGFHLTASNATMPFIAASRTLLPKSLRCLKTAIEKILSDPLLLYPDNDFNREALTTLCDQWEATR